MKLLTFSQLTSTVWPGIDLAEEFGQGMLKGLHFCTRMPAPRCLLLQVTTPSTAASIQAEHQREHMEDMDNVLFFVTPVGSLSIPLLEKVVNAARPFQVALDPDTLASDLKAECASHLGPTLWMDDSAPPTGWEAQIRAELGR